MKLIHLFHGWYLIILSENPSFDSPETLFFIFILYHLKMSSFLFDFRLLFFSDSESWQPTIPLRDIHNHVDQIFRLGGIFKFAKLQIYSWFFNVRFVNKQNNPDPYSRSCYILHCSKQILLNMCPQGQIKKN